MMEEVIVLENRVSEIIKIEDDEIEPVMTNNRQSSKWCKGRTLAYLAKTELRSYGHRTIRSDPAINFALLRSSFSNDLWLPLCWLDCPVVASISTPMRALICQSSQRKGTYLGWISDLNFSDIVWRVEYHFLHLFWLGLLITCFQNPLKVHVYDAITPSGRLIWGLWFQSHA